jgi:beta-glucosidase
MPWDMTDMGLADLVRAMSIEEKVALLNGRHLWKTAMNFRLNVPEIVMTDGTHGVRYAAEQVEGSASEQDALAQFLAVVNRRSDDGADALLGGSRPATCFPTDRPLPVRGTWNWPGISAPRLPANAGLWRASAAGAGHQLAPHAAAGAGL